MKVFIILFISEEWTGSVYTAKEIHEFTPATTGKSSDDITNEIVINPGSHLVYGCLDALSDCSSLVIIKHNIWKIVEIFR